MAGPVASAPMEANLVDAAEGWILIPIPQHTSLHFVENWIPQSQLGLSFAVQTFAHQIS